MSKTIEAYLERIPEEFRQNVKVTSAYIGNRTKISFSFGCGCIRDMEIKSLFLLKSFKHCSKCKNKYIENVDVIKYKCKYCLKERGKKSTIEACEKKCKEHYESLTENVDYVVCKICNFHSKGLGNHLNKIHNLSSKDYIKTYNSPAISTKSSETYSKQNGTNGNFINKCREKGIDLTEYWQKVSDGVRNSILSNPDEIKRRSELMGKINQTDLMRQKASETAKKTSARPEIIAQRTKQLADWREANPKEFSEKCSEKLCTTYNSKPETMLFDFVSKLSEFSFTRNQFVKSEKFTTKNKKKQVDMGDKNKRIYIEFDGAIHFKPIHGEDALKKVQEKDKLLEEHINKHNWTLIRISEDQFVYRTRQIDRVKYNASFFKEECLTKLVEILNSKIPGVYKIGEKYGKH